MTKYFRTWMPARLDQQLTEKPVKDPPPSIDPDKPRKDPRPFNPDKPVVPPPFDPDPSSGDPIVDPADEPLLQT
jgi:hypothetical protein